MKNLIIVIIALLSISAAQSQGKVSKYKTSEFLVYGVCDMCKERIENSLNVVGVKSANWDKESGIVSVMYHSKKLNEDNLHLLISSAGYRTEKMAADKKAYEALPECCRYDDGIEKH